MNTIVHELNHAKQFEISYKTNAEEALSSYVSKLEEELSFVKELKQKGYDIVAELKKPLKEFLGITPANSLKQSSKEYELGLKYIENQKNYISATKDPRGYMEQPLEKESFHVEKLMDKSLNYFLSPWRIS